MDRKLVILCACVLPLLFGCGPSGPDSNSDAEADGRQVFEVKGRIVSIPDDRESLVIRHEEIPDFMPAMTMPFYLDAPSSADGLEEGDTVQFDYIVEERRSWIENIETIDADQVSVGGQGMIQRRTIPIPRLDSGDQVPGFQLVSQDDEAFSMTDFYGKAVVMTFIFTRCPVPDFCPKMSHQFQEIQREALADEELRDRFHLLSVTIDPEFDTPEVLAGYAEQFTEDQATWTFATGSADRIDEVTTRFSVFIEDNEEMNTIDHVLATALIGPEGKLVRIWRGNAWEPDEVVTAMRETFNNN